MSTVNTEKFTLKLPPEATKVLPWLIAAKKGGKTKDIEWAKREYEIAERRAREREEWEQEHEERRLARVPAALCRQ